MVDFFPDRPQNVAPYNTPTATVPRENMQALASGLGGRSWVGNDDFRLWPAGDSAAPAYWTLSGAGATIARCGTGLADTTQKVGDYCAKVTAGTLKQTLVPTGDAWSRLSELLVPEGSSVDVSWGAWLYSSDPGSILPFLYNGNVVGRASYRLSEAGALSVSSEYHPGDAAWWWMMGRMAMVGGAGSHLSFWVDAPAGKSFYISGPTVLLGSAFPFNWQPCECKPFRIVIPLQGDLDLVTTPYTTIGGTRVRADKPWLIRETHVSAIVGPTGDDLVVDVNKSGTSMYSTLPQIDDGATVGEAEPDGTYANRCLARGDYLSVDLDQKGSTVDGEDLTVQVRGEAYVRPQDRFLAPAEVG